MKYLNLTAFAAILLTGAVMLVQGAPSRRNSLNTWPFDMEEADNTADNHFQKSPIFDKVSVDIFPPKRVNFYKCFKRNNRQGKSTI